MKINIQINENLKENLKKSLKRLKLFFHMVEEDFKHTSRKKYHLPLHIAAELVFVFIFACMMVYSQFEAHVEEVDMQYVIMNRNKPLFVLLDVRNEAIFNGRAPFAGMRTPPIEGLPGGHIPGSVNFPVRNLNSSSALSALEAKGITSDTTVILYCNSGGLSSRFADTIIRRFNFSPAKLKHYRGGISDWIKDEANTMVPEDHDPPYYSNDYWTSYGSSYSESTGGK